MSVDVPSIAFEYSQAVSNCLHLAAAYVLSFIIGFDREKEGRSAGLRTFPIVGTASCGFLLIGIKALGTNADAQARVLYGLMTGIGFIGGGAILKDHWKVSGTATAASIWNTGAIGAAIALRCYDIALCLMLLNFLTLRLTPLKKYLEHDQSPEEEKPEIICRS